MRSPQRYAAAYLLVAGSTTVDALDLVQPVVKMDGAFCNAKLNDHSHLFHRMWSAEGWSTRSLKLYRHVLMVLRREYEGRWDRG